MLVNNKKRFNIVLQMADPYNYSEFLKMCLETDTEPLDFNEYAQKIQCLLSAKVKYPELILDEAYIKLIEEQGGMLLPSIIVDGNPDAPLNPVKQKEGCTTCGGGKVL